MSDENITCPNCKHTWTIDAYQSKKGRTVRQCVFCRVLRSRRAYMLKEDLPPFFYDQYKDKHRRCIDCNTVKPVKDFEVIKKNMSISRKCTKCLFEDA